jgi:hypothetical protein
MDLAQRVRRAISIVAENTPASVAWVSALSPISVRSRRSGASSYSPLWRFKNIANFIADAKARCGRHKHLSHDDADLL